MSGPTLQLAADRRRLATVLALLVGFPIAYGMARRPSAGGRSLLMLVILPFWTSFLIRVYAWIGILKTGGPAQQAPALARADRAAARDPATPTTAVYIGIVYSYLPFMILPLYANLEKHDPTLIEAAADLGCPPSQASGR